MNLIPEFKIVALVKLQPSSPQDQFCHSITDSLSLSPLQYLGHVEVEESRGMHICEDAVKRLKTVGFTVLPGTRLSKFPPSCSPRSLFYPFPPFISFSPKPQSYRLFPLTSVSWQPSSFCPFFFLSGSSLFIPAQVPLYVEAQGVADSYHLSSEGVSTQHDLQTTSRGVRGLL